nr:HAMP domain-containing sensor histidine kinase [Archangium violaceum]
MDGRMRTHLGVVQLPEAVGSLEELLRGVGFRQRPGADLWEHEGRLLRAGERALEDGARLLWTLPIEGDEELVRRRVRYLGLASHDLRGSLANVRSYAALLLNGRIPLEPKAKRGLETILRNTDRALSFAQDFFDASRADLGMLACEPEKQPLEPLLAQAVEHQLEAAGAASVGLSLELPGTPLPEVEVDAGRVQHAVEAFIRHHLLHVQPGEQLRVRARPEDGGLRVEVRRDGVPPSEEETALTFAREERAFREKKLEDPLRLGLARQEIEALGGSVGVTTDEGGTTLFLTLPIALSSSASAQA